jgi:hypothetical protein
MLNYQNAFEIELKKLIGTEIERLKENLSNGLSVVDYADYKHQVGRIKGLLWAIEACDESNSILSQK